MTSRVEALSRRRQVVLMVMASAFLVWQVPYMDMFAGASGAERSLADMVSLMGFLVWALGLVILLVSGRTLARELSRENRAALEDELVRWNRSRAFTVGYGVALLTAAVMFAVSVFQPVSGADAAHVILVAAVVAPMYAFVLLERLNA